MQPDPPTDATGDQHRLQRQNWALAAYAASISTIARSADPQDLMSRVCRAIVEPSVAVKTGIQSRHRMSALGQQRCDDCSNISISACYKNVHCASLTCRYCSINFQEYARMRQNDHSPMRR